MAEQSKPARTKIDAPAKAAATGGDTKPSAPAREAAAAPVATPAKQALAVEKKVETPKPVAKAEAPKPVAKADAPKQVVKAAAPGRVAETPRDETSAPAARAPAPVPAMIAKPIRDVVQKSAAVSVKAAQTPTEGMKTMATTAEKITADASATSQAAADRMKGAFTDMQGRAKSAMEKGARFYEEMGEFTKGNVEAMIASSRAAASAVESLSQDAAAYGKQSFEQASQTFKNAAAVKSPNELFQLQSDYARSAFDALVAESSRMTEKMMKLTGEVVQPLSSRFAVAAEKVKSSAL